MTLKAKIVLCYAFFWLGLANFAAFLFLAIRLGGDAVNGKAEDGRFFLMEQGVYTEVSEAVFNYSRWHVYSVWVTYPLGVAAAILGHRYRKQRAAQEGAAPNPP